MSNRLFILAGLILISLTIVTGCSGGGGGGTSNDLDLDTMVSANGNGFVAVAREKIFSGKGSIHIDTSSATGDGGNVILIAGATSVKAAQSTTITGRSGFGGDVDLGNLNSVTIDTRSFAPGHSGGSVTIVAYAQRPGSSVGGHISLPQGLTILTGGTGTGASGQITLIGEAQSSPAWPVTVQTGALNTTGSQNAAMIVIETATPSSDSPVTIIGGYASPQQSINGTVVSGMFQFGTVQEGAVKTGALTAAGDGGSVLVLAGSNAAADPAISTQDITTSSSSSSGRVLLMAGATMSQTQANCFDIDTGNIDTHSTSKQPGFPVTVVTPGAINSGSINTSCSSPAINSGASAEVTMVAGSFYKPGAGITVRGGIDTSVQSAFSLGAATITLIGLGATSDIAVINPDGPAINASATGQSGGGAGALLIATPGKITLENNSGSGYVVDTHGSSTLSGSQVFLSSGGRTGTAISILANGAPGIINTSGGQLGYGNVWVLTAGGNYTNYTAIGDPSPNNFTNLGQSQAVIGPGAALTLTFTPGHSPTGYCPGGYTSIGDSEAHPARINIVETGNNEPLEVPILVTGRAGIALSNPGSFIEATYVKSGGSNPDYSVMKLFSAGPIAAPVANGTSGQLFGITALVSTTGDVAVSALSPVSLFNVAVTPGTLSVSSSASQPVGSPTPAITDYGAMVAGNSINISSTGSTGNSDIVLSPAPPAQATLWEYCVLAGTVNVSAGGSGAILSYGQLYCANLALNSGSGQISVDSPADLNVQAAGIQFRTDGAVSVRDAWPATLKTSNGDTIQVIDVGGFVTVDEGSLVAGIESIEFMSSIPGGSVNVTNNGLLMTSGASSIVGINGSGPITVAGIGAINAWQLNVGNLDPVTLAIQPPYVAVSPPGNYSLGNISITGQDITAELMYVSGP
jgi:hypothetical protein